MSWSCSVRNRHLLATASLTGLFAEQQPGRGVGTGQRGVEVSLHSSPSHSSNPYWAKGAEGCVVVGKDAPLGANKNFSSQPQ